MVMGSIESRIGMIIKFGTSTLDVNARRLLRDGAPVHVTPKAFDVLVLLAQARPRAVKKAEILERVWPDTFVTDASLARTVHEIRDVLGDADGAVIRTVHGHGYAFGVDATNEYPTPRSTGPGEPVGAPRAWLHFGLQTVPLHDGEMVIGRDPAVAIPVSFPLTSWHHARLTVSFRGVTIEDLGSKNGTRVRGERLVAALALRDGDDVTIGTAEFVFRSGAARTATTDTAPSTPGRRRRDQ